MPLQVNARLDDTIWEQVVEAMPGISNAERLTQLVQNHVTLLRSRRELSAALQFSERMLAPVLQNLREQNLQGRGSELAESIAQTVIELSAVLLSRADALAASPEKTVPELEALLVQRFTRTALQILRTSALAPDSVRNPAAVQPETRRIFDETRILSANLPHSTSNNAQT